MPGCGRAWSPHLHRHTRSRRARGAWDGRIECGLQGTRWAGRSGGQCPFSPPTSANTPCCHPGVTSSTRGVPPWLLVNVGIPPYRPDSRRGCPLCLRAYPPGGRAPPPPLATRAPRVGRIPPFSRGLSRKSPEKGVTVVNAKKTKPRTIASRPVGRPLSPARRRPVSPGRGGLLPLRAAGARRGGRNRRVL